MRFLTLATAAILVLGGCVLSPPTTTVVHTDYYDPAFDHGYDSDSSYGGYGEPETRGDNPLIQSFTANPGHRVAPGQAVTFQVVAYDPARRPLQYNWSATGGTLSTTTGHVAVWTPTSPGTYAVTVTASNGRGGFATGTLNMVAGDEPRPVSSPLFGALPSPSPSPAMAWPTAPSPSPAWYPTPTPIPADHMTAGVEGTVEDADGPLAGVEVRLVSTEPTRPYFRSHVTTEDGAFTFDGIPIEIPMVLTLAKPGYAERAQALTLAPGEARSIRYAGDGALTPR